MKLSKIFLMGVVSILLICGITYKKDSKKEYILNDNIKQEEFSSIAMYKVDGDKETKIDKMPEGNYVIDETKSYCILKGEKEHDKEAKLYTNDKGEHVIGNLAPEEKCFVYFKEKEKNSSEVLTMTLKREQCSDTPTFSATDTQEHKGTNLKTCLYKAEDDFGDSYYYRGKLNDNWVRFGKTGTSSNTGEDIWWRIIRINGDGSIRMIYAGTGSDTTKFTSDGYVGNAQSQIENNNTYQFNTQRDNSKYVGYFYGDGNLHTSNTIGSNAYNQVNTWFITNLSDEWNNGDGRIDKNTGFCGDRSNNSNVNYSWSEGMTDTFPNVGTSETQFGPLLRLNNNKQPTYKCGTTENKNNDWYTYTEAENANQKETDIIIKGNKKLEYPIGLITLDEAYYAGGYRDSNKRYYLYSNTNYWTISPSSFNSSKYANVFDINVSGTLGGDSVYTAHGLRPVINLKSSTQFTGEGTLDNPYTIKN